MLNLDKHLVDIAYNAMLLEGVNITIASVVGLIHDFDVCDMKEIDKQITKNFINALSWTNNFDLDKFDKYQVLDYAMRLNYYILNGLHSYAGRIRENFIYVSGSSYIPEAESEYKIRNDLAKNIDNIINNPLLIYLFITRRQIFSDGNKRTALLMTNLLLQHKDPNKVFYVPIQNKDKYEKELIKYYETNNPKEFLKYLSNFVFDIQNDSLGLSWTNI